jgi:hypothetical protein
MPDEMRAFWDSDWNSGKVRLCAVRVKGRWWQKAQMRGLGLVVVDQDGRGQE